MKKNKKHYDKYKKFDVVYADFGRNPHGVQGGIRPGIVVCVFMADSVFAWMLCRPSSIHMGFS